MDSNSKKNRLRVAISRSIGQHLFRPFYLAFQYRELLRRSAYRFRTGHMGFASKIGPRVRGTRSILQSYC
jgi:hypothetical protein